MTDLIQTPPPALESLSAPRPYTAPRLTTLGSVEVLTAGPDGGILDQIIGSGGSTSGGFQPDTTS